jgi:predicted dehydrogenase
VLRLKGGRADDSFTVVLQYGRERKDLICTVKTTVVSTLPMEKQLKFMVRGRDGTFLKVSDGPTPSMLYQKPILTTSQNGEDPQIDQLFAGVKADDSSYGVEPEKYHGELFTKTQFDDSQSQDGGLWSGRLASEQGSYVDYYKDVVAAIKGEKEVVVKPEESRMGIRVIELAMESAEKGVTVEWSES